MHLGVVLPHFSEHIDDFALWILMAAGPVADLDCNLISGLSIRIIFHIADLYVIRHVLALHYGPGLRAKAVQHTHEGLVIATDNM